MKILSIKDTGPDIEVRAVSGIWPFKRQRFFIGEGTVWYDMNTGRRAGTFTESEISDRVAIFRLNKGPHTYQDNTPPPEESRRWDET